MAKDYDRKNKKSMSKTDDWKKVPGKKNTRAWCNGKVGREHITVLVEDPWYTSKDFSCSTRAEAFPWMNIPNTKMRWFCIHEQRCAVCNKILRHNLRSEECPVYIQVYGIED